MNTDAPRYVFGLHMSCICGSLCTPSYLQ